MAQIAVEVAQLTKAFGGVRAVEGVSMRVPMGQRLALLGPNGAGKTTLFNCITGALSPTSGKVFLFGQDVTSLAEHRRIALGIGRTYQITKVFHNLTTLENVILAVQGNRSQKWILHRSLKAFPESSQSAEKALTRVGLSKRIYDSVQQLSYGERRQLEFAMALASQPRTLFLDEPCAGLSPAERQHITKIIAGFPQDITLILIEHDMDVALSLAEQVIVLHRGSVIFEGSPEEVRTDTKVREVYLGKA
jgi:branched-chain amino acid transport system ATP-binding protein